MIQTKYGDLLSVTSGYIIQGVNSQGVMNSGVAKAIRDKYPKVYNAYINHYKSGNMKVGTFSGTRVDSSELVEEALFIINAVTQEHYGRDPNKVYVDYDGLRMCFTQINDFVLDMLSPKVVNFPLIGCGLANGDWNIVSQIIDEELDDSIEKVLWIKE